MDLAGSSPGVFVESSSSPGQSYYHSQGWWQDLYYLDNTANFCIKALSGEIIPPSPRVISPTDGACGVNSDIVLKWATGQDVDLHAPEYYDFYFGTDFSNVNNADSSWPVGTSVYKGRFPADTSSFDPGGLEPDTYYYWRIDEVNESDTNSPYKGAVWSFTTSEIVYYVPDDYPTIQEAIDSACDGATIVVAEGTYHENIVIEGKNLAIISTDPNDPNVVFATVIDGDQKDCVVQFFDCGSDVIFSGFTITDGNSSYGGGIYCGGSSTTITNCTITGNQAKYGGGMSNWSSSPTVINCAYGENSADEGGGMFNEGGSPAATNCIFRGNSAAFGGGMYNSNGSSPTLNNCTFSGDSAYESGGGMYNERGSPTITNCIFSGNSAEGDLFNGGGGMCNSNGSSPTLNKCTFSGNSANESGGGMYNSNGSAIVTNCSFSGNSAGGGGGMCNRRSSPTLTNCTFSGNSAGSGGGMDNFDNSSPTVTNCMFSGNSVVRRGGGMCNSSGSSSPTLVNCVFSGNSSKVGGGMYNRGSPTLTNCTFLGNSALNGSDCACNSTNQNWPGDIEMVNCILWSGGQEIWNNDGSTITISYTDLRGNRAACFDPCNAIVWGPGNIDADPLFADSANNDYHLKSTAGRWDPKSKDWMQDDVKSPCIDAGDPINSVDREPEPNGGIINMGAYGGTLEASKSPLELNMSIYKTLNST